MGILTLAKEALLLSALLSAPLLRSSARQEEAKKPDAKLSDEPARGLKLREKGTFDGYTLFSPVRSKTTFLVDMDGKVVHEWKTELPPGASDYFLANGHLLRCKRIEDTPVFHGGGTGGGVQELDWDGKVVWEYTLATETQHHHHDIRPMPNGHILVITWEKFTKEEAIARGRDPEQVGDEGLWPDAVLEIEPTRPEGAKIAWEWHVRDHLVQDRDAKKAGYGKLADHPELVDINAGRRTPRAETPEERKKREDQEARMRGLGYAGGADDGQDPKGKHDPPPDARPGDAKPGDAGAGAARAPEPPHDLPPPLDADWLHTNSVDYDAEHDLVLLSSPRLSEIFLLDHSTTTAEAATHAGGKRGHGGDLVWRYGNPKNYGAGAEGDRRLFGQHDARWIAAGRPGAGHVLVFNNGSGRADGDYSSVDELVLPFDAKGGFVHASSSAYGPKDPIWSYAAKESFYSDFISGADRLPNGNTLVMSGTDGRVFEVSSEKKVVWEYWNPFGGEVPPRPPPPGAPPSKRPPVRPIALFRATRLALDHPGLAGKTLR